jgi:hypothetical protein
MFCSESGKSLTLAKKLPQNQGHHYESLPTDVQRECSEPSTNAHTKHIPIWKQICSEAPHWRRTQSASYETDVFIMSSVVSRRQFNLFPPQPASPFLFPGLWLIEATYTHGRQERAGQGTEPRAAVTLVTRLTIASTTSPLKGRSTMARYLTRYVAIPRCW